MAKNASKGCTTFFSSGRRPSRCRSGRRKEVRKGDLFRRVPPAFNTLIFSSLLLGLKRGAPICPKELRQLAGAILWLYTLLLGVAAYRYFCSS
ncbi:hypothetical protein TYRP_000781 [Tyrophagus putrescentiae]|nr:hypothetical protein TYRP_000781 [Tyrophagus putrescentiae]